VLYLDHLERSRSILDQRCRVPGRAIRRRGQLPARFLCLHDLPCQSARDQRVNDATDLLQRSPLCRFVTPPLWLGYAEEHWLEIDLAIGVKQGDRFILCLNGWTDYAYRSDLRRVQAGIEMLPCNSNIEIGR
jgi:hypothetical protein